MELTLRFPETFPETAKSVPLNPPVLRGVERGHCPLFDLYLSGTTYNYSST